ncbi:hypothetical protein VM1G_04535 [Cytospora mali]|uniref:Uncharacterized protein n=1 Tax=Cytospora mali TaxID=578113 RepID=A0A194VX67_CYTMA|nr:hypothetical protein VM1G_04535 [Valsa mali]
MKGNTVCDTWARIPGLSSYWCLQLQWRIDEDVVAALTEPRYPVPDEDLDTIILTQTIYLLQLFLHLHEFDPCLKEGDPDDDLLRLFQDILGREFNTVYGAPPARIYHGPCPDGEALERVVRGLMLAEKEGSEQQQREGSRSPQLVTTAAAAAAAAAVESSPASSSSSPDPTKSGLQHLVVQLLAELNRPLYKQKSRYEEVHGPRTDDTWASRLATRVVQWRYHMRNPVIQPALREQVIRVVEDVHALDEEGLEVYRALRTVAPGFIHVATPLQPDLQPPQPAMSASAPSSSHHHQQPPQAQPRMVNHEAAHHHQRSVSGGMKMQHILASPVTQTPDRTPTVSSNTPRTPYFQQQPGGGGAGGGAREGGGGGGGGIGSSAAAAAAVAYGGDGGNKRVSAQNVAYPPAKRPRSAHRYEAERYEGEYRRPKRERPPQLLPPPPPPVAAGNPAAAAAAAAAAAGEMPIRAAPGDGTNFGPEEDTDLLRRILDGVNGLHQRMHGMHRDLGRRFNALENRLQRLEEWITDPV